MSSSSRPRTLEFYRHVFMTDGFEDMVLEIKKELDCSGGITKERLNGWVKAVLYGGNGDGSVRREPVEPNLHDINKNYGRYKFEKCVFGLWIRGRNK